MPDALVPPPPMPDPAGGGYKPSPARGRPTSGRAWASLRVGLRAVLRHFGEQAVAITAGRFVLMMKGVINFGVPQCAAAIAADLVKVLGHQKDFGMVCGH